MNNLLRTLTESQVKNATGTDLKLLLKTVKEGRQSNDPKLSDPFYDSLEGLLLDLRTITIDNHDAEAFLKPVTKTEVPDYYDYIHNPMDLQTMMKRVKQKHYKSKREFKDDLELIWSNCRTYNAAQNHPLRQCAARLQAKAEKLLANITDRKDRTEPRLRSASPTGGHAPNGKYKSDMVNGIRPSRIPADSRLMSRMSSKKSMLPLSSKAASFADSPAILRTQEGMTMFQQLDRDLQADDVDQALLSRLKELSAPHFFMDERERHDMDNSMPIDGVVGDKRKMNGTSEQPPRKRTRFSPSSFALMSTHDTSDSNTLWWGAVQSDMLIANGLPAIPHASSSKRRRHPFTTPRALHQPSASNGPANAIASSSKLPPKTKKKRKPTQPVESAPPKSLLTLMNNNISTMRRVRRTHAKYTALNITSSGPSNEDDADPSTLVPPLVPAFSKSSGSVHPPAPNDEDLVPGALEDDKVDDRPWKIPKSGIEVGERNADSCLNWANSKILEHAGFQGTSSIALNVMNGVLAEYLMNVGRTIHFFCEKHANTMTSEEIILHTLFESGISKIQDLEQFVSDDVERYGNRLGDLEKKIVGAYREATITDVINDDDLFEENEDDEGAFVLGNFADVIGDDFLGLRELGIAAEFGMSSLSIPKRLLKGKKDRSQAAAAAKTTEPALPYPLPPPLIPLTSDKVDDQIGLLRPYYANRMAALQPVPVAIPTPTPSNAPPNYLLGPLPPASGSSLTDLPNLSQLPSPFTLTPPPSAIPVIVTLPDDAPLPSRAKMGPLGQINKPASYGAVGSAGTSGTSKKKSTTAKMLATVPAPSAITPSSSMLNGVAMSEDGSTIANAPTPQTMVVESPAPLPPSPTKKKTGTAGSGGSKKKGPGHGHEQSPIPPHVAVSARA